MFLQISSLFLTEITWDENYPYILIKQGPYWIVMAKEDWLLCFRSNTIILNQGREPTSHTFSTMFSQLAKRSAGVLPADLSTDHAHYVKNHRSTVLRRNKNMAVEGETVSHYYILVIRKFIDIMLLFRHGVWFSFSFLNNFPLQNLEYSKHSSV